MEGILFWNSINNWKASENLTTLEYRILLECYRRAHMFKKGKYGKKMIYLNFPSDAKPAVIGEYITPTTTITPRVLNWYDLTKKGIDCLNKLENEWDFKWNLPLFESRFPYI